MKRVSLAVLGLLLVASTSGCCCFERMFCGGCGGGCGSCAYGHEGGCSDGCGGGCSDCGMAGNSIKGGGGSYAKRGAPPEAYAEQQYALGPNGQPMGKHHPAQHHPLVHQRRNAGGQYEFAAGPPSGGVSYPYYTNRGPRDFLARNPRSIGP